MKPITYNQVKNLVCSTKEYKEFREEFIKRLNAFSKYPKALDVTVFTGFSFILSISNHGFPDEIREYELNASCNTRCLVAKELFDNKDYFNLVFKRIIEDLTKSINEYHYDLHWDYRVFNGLRLKELRSDINFPIHISNMIAWDYDSVGTYFIEQECGEHWITLPIYWGQDQPTFHRDVEREVKQLDY